MPFFSYESFLPLKENLFDILGNGYFIEFS